MPEDSVEVLKSISADRIRETVHEANAFAAANPLPSGKTTEWMRTRSPEQLAVLRAVHELQVNGPGVVDLPKAELIDASPPKALMQLLSTYAKELKPSA
ncbi:MAG: hypothetical protein GEU73_10715 [Chloroflexi bacterium]|nr:hypothetical protein [Chloroflexota bacterium]